MGALIVIGDGPDVLSVCSGGFLLDAEYTPQRLYELAKMDGAIILASDCSRSRVPTCTSCPIPTCPPRRPAPATAPPSASAARSTSRSSRCPKTCRSSRSTAAGEALARAHAASAGARRPGAADPRSLQGAPRLGERFALGPRGRGPRHRARRRHRAPARRDGAAHRGGDRRVRRRARQRRPAGDAAARGAHGRRRRRPAARRQGLLTSRCRPRADRPAGTRACSR